MKLSIITEDKSTNSLYISGDTLVNLTDPDDPNSRLNLGDGVDFRPIHCSELRKKLQKTGWRVGGIKFYQEIKQGDDLLREFKYKLELPDNYLVSDRSTEDGLPVINPATENVSSPNMIISREDIDQIKSGVNNIYESIFGEQRGERELKILRSTKSRIDIVDEIITIPVIDSKRNSTYTNMIDLTSLLEHSPIPELQAKMDLTYLYSIKGVIYGGDETLTLFTTDSSGNVTNLNQIIEKDNIVIEYINSILRILPKTDNVDEYIINDAIITYGNLSK